MILNQNNILQIVTLFFEPLEQIFPCLHHELPLPWQDFSLLVRQGHVGCFGIALPILLDQRDLGGLLQDEMSLMVVIDLNPGKIKDIELFIF